MVNINRSIKIERISGERAITFEQALMKNRSKYLFKNQKEDEKEAILTRK